LGRLPAAHVRRSLNPIINASPPVHHTRSSGGNVRQGGSTPSGERPSPPRSGVPLRGDEGCWPARWPGSASSPASEPGGRRTRRSRPVPAAAPRPPHSCGPGRGSRECTVIRYLIGARMEKPPVPGVGGRRPRTASAVLPTHSEMQVRGRRAARDAGCRPRHLGLLTLVDPLTRRTRRTD
jgi:hypothetical protein